MLTLKNLEIEKASDIKERIKEQLNNPKQSPHLSLPYPTLPDYASAMNGLAQQQAQMLSGIGSGIFGSRL